MRKSPLGNPFVFPSVYTGMKHYTLLLLLLMMMAACKKEKCDRTLCDEPAIDNSSCTSDSLQCTLLILGKWDWTQTIGSWTLATFNPCTDSVHRSYEFLNNGSVLYYENDQLLSNGTYSFSNSSGLMLNAQDSLVTFALGGWVSICDDYLVVDASPVDGAKVTLMKQE